VLVLRPKPFWMILWKRLTIGWLVERGCIFLRGVGLLLLRALSLIFLLIFLSLFPIPATMAKRIEKLQRNFLWEGLNEKFKYHLVKWDKVCFPISEGHLGIRKLRVFNQVLLGKWLWRYAYEREVCWRIIVDAKYGSNWGGWHSVDTVGLYGVGIWRYISKGGGFFLATLDSIQVMDPKSNFGMMFGAEKRVSRKLFQAYTT
jgi:hypothetical protein